LNKTLLVILVDKRKASAVKVQQVLTDWGCVIKTRLGIHDGALDNCSDGGLIILEILATSEQKTRLTHKLEQLDGVSTELVEIAV